jgi:hypothetical protein
MGRRLIVALGAVLRCSERGHWDGDKQCYIVEHAYAFSCAASASRSCPAASASQIRLLGNLSGFKARCVGTPFHSSLHRLVTCYGAKGAPIHVSGRVWVKRLEPEITLLTDVSEAIVDLVS